MVPTHQNSSTSPATRNQDHQLQPYNTSKPDQASSSSCLSAHAFTNSIQDQGGFYPKEPLNHLQYQQEPNNLAINGVSDDNSAPIRENNRGLKFSLSKKEEGYGNQTGSSKWMCSKMAMNSVQMSSEAQTNALIMKFEDQKLESSPLENDTGSNTSSSSNSNNPVRVCSACNTTKTPLWRSGPTGPKSLCNACGIRQRKARKAMAVVAAATTTTTSNDTVSGTENSPLKVKLQHKAKRCKNGLVSQCKKRSKLENPIPHGRKKLCFEKFLMNLSKNLALPQVFPQDEKEAAILLMALSCGLVHG